MSEQQGVAAMLQVGVARAVVSAADPAVQIV
jgi:hypothetical protein